jgi:hypothetical protein
VPGADAYRVTFLDAELSEIATLDAPEPWLRLDSDRVDTLLPRPGDFAVMVTALRDGDPLDRSAPRPFRLAPGPSRGPAGGD